MEFRLSLLALWLLFAAHTAIAECVGLTNGSIVFDVLSCKSVVPKEDFDSTWDYSFFKNLPPSEKKQFLNAYSGFVVVGKVVKSDAIKKGLSKERGALKGKDLKLHLPRQAEMSCNAIQKKRVKGTIEEFCCQGSADAPCLLQTPYKLLEVSVVGNAESEAGDKMREVAKSSKAYKKGLALFKKGKHKQAVKKLEQAKRDGALDVKGHYILGMTYRKLDKCRKAIPVLKIVFDRSEKNKVWADEEKTVRRSNFLLARCYAMTNQPGRSTIILNSYLVDPKKYSSEIKESLRNSDFGWINSTRDYRDYVKEARKRLR